MLVLPVLHGLFNHARMHTAAPLEETPMGDTTVFGVWLKSRRKALDLRQEDLAELVGCAMMTIQKIEAGERLVLTGPTMCINR